MNNDQKQTSQEYKSDQKCNSDKISLKSVSWGIFIVVVIVSIGFTYNFICASCRSADAMEYIYSTCHSLQQQCPDTSKHSSAAVVSCYCHKAAITDTTIIRKKLECLTKCADNAFDTNVLTFLISFSLIALLTLLISEGDKMHKLKEEVVSIINNYKEFNSTYKKSITDSLNREKLIYRYNLLTQSIRSDCVVFASTIMSSNYVNHILPAIESTRSRITSFNDDIQFYSKGTREEDIFTRTEIAELSTPLYFAENQIEDLISGARVYFNGHYKTEPSKLQHISIFERDISPLRDDIHSLIEKFESYLEAPQNREG